MPEPLLVVEVAGRPRRPNKPLPAAPIELVPTPPDSFCVAWAVSAMAGSKLARAGTSFMLCPNDGARRCAGAKMTTDVDLLPGNT